MISVECASDLRAVGSSPYTTISLNSVFAFRSLPKSMTKKQNVKICKKIVNKASLRSNGRATSHVLADSVIISDRLIIS